MEKHAESLPRGAFLAQVSLLTATLATPSSALAANPPPGTSGTIIRGLQTLLDGNARFVADQSLCPPHSVHRMELAQGQEPFAIIVSCSDSRVPTDTVFDQSPGDIFGVRIAGNFVDDHGLGSIEYSVATLKSSLILVLGHTHCGAIKAAVQYVKDGTKPPGQIASLVDELAPSAKATKGSSGDWVENAIEQNVRDTVAALPKRSAIISEAMSKKLLRIAGGVYDLHTGKVRVLP